MNKLKRFLNLRAAHNITAQIIASDAINRAITKSKHKIPVLIVSFNNSSYLRNIVEQLNKREIIPIVIDNHSTDAITIALLQQLEKGSAEVIRSKRNLGHLVGFLDPIYKILPEIFAYTDPDLQFHPQLPENFLEELAGLTELYQCYKAGMALDISSFGEMKKLESSTTRKYPFQFYKEHDVLDWEQQFWTMPLKHDRLEVYAAAIDTTFAVYQKKYYHSGDFSRGVRVAGNFTACHLPWFSSVDIVSDVERNIYIDTKNSDTGSWIK
jgi:glycosyltransferase involved in cell wall biosynthesis